MISMDKKYRTRDGRNVRILCVDRKEDYYKVVAFITNKHGDSECEQVVSYGIKGNYYRDESETQYDLIEVSPYEDFKIDDKVLVSNTGIHWDKRHFAGVDSSGKALFYPFGKSSYTCPQEEAKSANFCRKADENV